MALLTAWILGMVLWAGMYIHRYRRFVAALSGSTAYAYDAGSLAAVVNGQEQPLNGESAYTVYRWVTEAGMGRQVKSLPDAAADGQLLYGDGAALSLWAVELEGEMTPHGREAPRQGVLLCYEDAEGWRYLYDTPALDMGMLLAVLQSDP